MILSVAFMSATWILLSEAKWWGIGILSVGAVTVVGEDKIMRILLIVSALAAAIWLNCKFLFNVQL